MQRAIVWDEDGTESSVALAVEPAGYAFIVNGKCDGSARSDAGTQVMHGLLGALLNPEARRSLVIGLGTGSTAGWLGAVPGMERVDVVELEPLIVDIARACDEVNRDVLRNPKVRIDDRRRARNAAHRARPATTSSRRSRRTRSAPASRASSRGVLRRRRSERLTDGGLFLQWVQLYEIDARTLRTVYATIASVFPHVEAWEAGGSDLVLVGAKQPLIAPRRCCSPRASRRNRSRRALNVAWRAVDLHRPAGALRGERASGAAHRTTRPASKSTPTIATSSSSASPGRWAAAHSLLAGSAATGADGGP